MYAAIANVFCEAGLITKYLHLYIIILIKILTGADQHMMSKHRLVLNRATKHYMLSFPLNFPVCDMHFCSLGSTETLFSLHAPTDRR